MKLYRVTARLKHPGCYHVGYEYEAPAPNKAAAIRQARRLVWGDGHTRVEGGLIYTATELEE